MHGHPYVKIIFLIISAPNLGIGVIPVVSFAVSRLNKRTRSLRRTVQSDTHSWLCFISQSKLWTSSFASSSLNKPKTKHNFRLYRTLSMVKELIT